MNLLDKTIFKNCKLKRIKKISQLKNNSYYLLLKYERYGYWIIKIKDINKNNIKYFWLFLQFNQKYSENSINDTNDEPTDAFKKLLHMTRCILYDIPKEKMVSVLI